MDSANAVSERSLKAADRNLWQRVGSSLVLLPIVAIIVWWGEPLVSLVVTGLALLSLYELFRLFRAGGYRPRRAAGTAGLLLLIGAAALDAGFRLRVDWSGFALVATILLTLGAELPRRERQGSLINWALTLAGVVYIGWTFAHFVLLRAIAVPLLNTYAPLHILRLQPGAAWIVFVLAINFLSDTGAYFVGRAWGRHRMTRYISPKKSWEGAAGGLATATLAGVGLVPLLGLPISLLAGALIGAAGSIAGQMGDLAESLIKRQVDIKDSGDLIPGHGGILDRVDSLLFAAPLMYYLILLVMPG